MTKGLRQKAILSLLDDGPIASQDELRRALRQRGFRVEQATLSRDIRDLGLVKTSNGYQRLEIQAVASDPALPSVSRLVREFVLNVKRAQNLLVIKTTVGSAQPVAAALDDEEWPEAVGSVAGDDTILIICPDKKAATRLEARTQELLA
jgi:transcriptional regulator of arginine metabolism